MLRRWKALIRLKCSRKKKSTSDSSNRKSPSKTTCKYNYSTPLKYGSTYSYALFSPSRMGKKIKECNAIVTTNRILVYKGNSCLQIPFCYIQEVKQTGGMMSTPGIEININRPTQLPPYELDYYKNVLKERILPAVLEGTPPVLFLRFHDKTRDNFFNMCIEA